MTVHTPRKSPGPLVGPGWRIVTPSVVTPSDRGGRWRGLRGVGARRPHALGDGEAARGVQQVAQPVVLAPGEGIPALGRDGRHVGRGGGADGVAVGPGARATADRAASGLGRRAHAGRRAAPPEGVAVQRRLRCSRGARTAMRAIVRGVIDFPAPRCLEVASGRRPGGLHRLVPNATAEAGFPTPPGLSGLGVQLAPRRRRVPASAARPSRSNAAAGGSDTALGGVCAAGSKPRAAMR